MSTAVSSLENYTLCVAQHIWWHLQELPPCDETSATKNATVPGTYTYLEYEILVLVKRLPMFTLFIKGY
jgi:hypothetical protein